ncbi:hypothetical protein BDF22DRAFT_745132 [Syncephalis plumigaleata]|nr:hypothetical protein BDF22DRAFT_745132 [Syncephalis plumigaleata]
MSPRFPNPRDVKNAVQRREILRTRWEKDAELLCLVVDIVKKEQTSTTTAEVAGMKLSALSQTIRSNSNARQLVPSVGFGKWLKKSQWHSFIKLVYETVITENSNEENAPSPSTTSTCTVQWTGRYPDKKFLDHVRQGGVEAVDDEELRPLSPDASLYKPDAPVTSEDARNMKTLPSAFETPLSNQIVALNKRLSISEKRQKENQHRRAMLERIISETELTNVKVHLFGSSANGLSNENSDLDMCVTSDEIDQLLKEQNGKRTKSKGKDALADIMRAIARKLKEHRMREVIPIVWARVPVVKFNYPVDNQAMDMAIANRVALRNTKLFYTYTQADPRVRPLLMTIKYWANQRVISDAAQNGNTINSYTHVLLVLNYLQIVGVIPPLQRICCGKYPPLEDCYRDDMRHCIVCQQPLPSNIVDGYETYFYDKPLVETSKNDTTLAQLLVDFLRYYAFEFNYADACVSVRKGTTIPRQDTIWPPFDKTDPGQNHALCVEDPFVLTRNTAVSAHPWVVEGIRWEYERALRALLSGRHLDGMCTPWTSWAVAHYGDVHVFEL